MAKTAAFIVVYWDGFGRRHRFSESLVDVFTKSVATKHASKTVVVGAVRAEVQDLEGNVMSRHERTRDGGSMQTYTAPKNAAKVVEPRDDTGDSSESGAEKRVKRSRSRKG